MKWAAKSFCYLLFFAIAVVCFGRFKKEYSTASSRDLEAAPGMASPGMDEGAGQGDAHASAAGKVTPTATGESTNGAASSQGVGETRSAGPSTNTGVAAGSKGSPGKASSRGKGGLQAFYLAGFVAGMLGLAGLGAWDVSQFVARKAASGIGVDFAPIVGDPEYDAAEEAWARGDHLGAINMLREFLKRRPSQQHAALRIAEIYEKDLGNHLAAALELEEVLQKPLPREKWGWTAVHLANLYSGKLNDSVKALEVLHRIVEGYPETAAARKARQRLGMPEPDSASGPGPGADVTTASDDRPAGSTADASMPQGFRMKKK